MDKSFIFQKDVLAQIHQHALEHYPIECCGWVMIEKKNNNQVWFPSQNLQDKYHKMDPETYPRTGKDAFIPEMQKLQRCLDENSETMELYSIVHSHVDCDAYFSDEDKLQMSDFETKKPIYNAENYLVVAVKASKIDQHAVFYFDEAQSDFLKADFGV